MQVSSQYKFHGCVRLITQSSFASVCDEDMNWLFIVLFARIGSSSPLVFQWNGSKAMKYHVMTWLTRTTTSQYQPHLGSVTGWKIVKYYPVVSSARAAISIAGSQDWNGHASVSEVQFMDFTCCKILIHWIIQKANCSISLLPISATFTSNIYTWSVLLQNGCDFIARQFRLLRSGAYLFHHHIGTWMIVFCANGNCCIFQTRNLAELHATDLCTLPEKCKPQRKLFKSEVHQLGNQLRILFQSCLSLPCLVIFRNIYLKC